MDVESNPGNDGESVPSVSLVMSEEDDDFEGGDNQIKKKDEIDVVNEAKAMDLFDNQASHDISNSDSMTVQ